VVGLTVGPVAGLSAGVADALRAGEPTGVAATPALAVGDAACGDCPEEGDPVSTDGPPQPARSTARSRVLASATGLIAGEGNETS
jgi:hypothetical protein